MKQHKYEGNPQLDMITDQLDHFRHEVDSLGFSSVCDSTGY
jgi:hypothetical protein